MPNVGYATLQIIPSVRGIAEEIRQQLAPAAGEGQRSGQETGRNWGEGFRRLLEAAGVIAVAEKITEGVSEAFSEAMDQSGIAGKLKVQLGATGPVAKQYGDIAGQLYAAGITDSVETAAEDIRAVASAGLLPPAATQAQIKSITTEFADFTSSFEQDSALTAQAVQAMIRNGLAANGTAALDLLTAGFQRLGPHAEDLVETMQEYPVQLKKLGLSGLQSLGLFSQGLQAGARDTDILADALKEFSIRAVDGSATTIAGYKGLGLNASKMAAQISKGGDAAAKGLDTVLDRLRKVPDPVKRSQLAVDLFGTQAEDLGSALYALDPSTAVKSIGDVGGAAQQMGTDLRDNAGARLTAFTRSLKQGLVQVIGGQVLPRLLTLGTAVQTKVGPPLSVVAGVLSRDVGPAMDSTGRFIAGTLVPALIAAAGWVQNNSTTLEIIGTVIGVLLLPLLLTLGVQWAIAGAAAVTSATAQVGAWIATSAGAVKSAALQVVASYRTVGGWVASGAAAIASGAEVVAGWVLTGAAAAAGAIAQGLAAAEVVAGWVLMGLQSLLQAARMAAAWLIALGPIGWITIAVLGIAALIIGNWQRISSWTSSIWNAIVGWITSAGTTVLNFLKANWPLILGILTGPIGLAVALIVKYWSQISAGFMAAYHAVIGIGTTLTGWVGGLPGRIAAALGSLGTKLYNAATAGFGRLKSGATAKAAELLAYVTGLPGDIKSELGDLSTLLEEAGKDIIRGLWNGISSLGDWLGGQIASLIKDKVPGPVRKVLHIGSPSRLMHQYGRWTAQGFLGGVVDESDGVAAAMQRMVTPPTVPAIAGPAGIAGGTTAPAAGLAAGTRLYLVLADGTQLDAYLDTRVDAALTPVTMAASAGRRT